MIEKYSLALDLLDAYDHQNMKRPEGGNTIYILSYEECRKVIDSMGFGESNDVFGNKKDDSFNGKYWGDLPDLCRPGSLSVFGRKSSKFVILYYKESFFSDGNKRIAAAIFLYFMDRNQALFLDDEKIISDHTLVALTIMIAESRPEEKEMMISVIMNCLK